MFAKTFSAKPADIKKEWWIIDMKDVVLGRAASFVAMVLQGKHKPSYTPHMDCGDNVILVNARHVFLSGKKQSSKTGKLYYRHTGFPGGIKCANARDLLNGKFPETVVKMAVKRMVSRGKLGVHRMKNLYVYPDEAHPHAGQKPIEVDFGKMNSKNCKR